MPPFPNAALLAVFPARKPIPRPAAAAASPPEQDQDSTCAAPSTLIIILSSSFITGRNAVPACSAHFTLIGRNCTPQQRGGQFPVLYNWPFNTNSAEGRISFSCKPGVCLLFGWLPRSIPSCPHPQLPPSTRNTVHYHCYLSMSSYPPTPAFGVFNFVPPKVPLAPVRPQQQQQGGASTHVSVLQADSTSRRPTLPPQRSQTGPSSASPSRASLSPAKMESHSSDALSDSPEEGELSESHSANRDNGSSNSPNISSDDEGRPLAVLCSLAGWVAHYSAICRIELRATVDRPLLDPPSNWYSSHYSGQSAPPDPLPPCL